MILNSSLSSQFSQVVEHHVFYTDAFQTISLTMAMIPADWISSGKMGNFMGLFHRVLAIEKTIKEKPVSKE